MDDPEEIDEEVEVSGDELDAAASFVTRTTYATRDDGVALCVISVVPPMEAVEYQYLGAGPTRKSALGDALVAVALDMREWDWSSIVRS